jgi:hypothetical protein
MTNGLPAQYPGKLRELQELCMVEAKKYQVPFYLNGTIDKLTVKPTC